jgi:hypothetical protein
MEPVSSVAGEGGPGGRRYKRENPFYDNLLYFHRSAELAYRWGTLDKRDEILTEPRPLYQVK